MGDSAFIAARKGFLGCERSLIKDLLVSRIPELKHAVLGQYVQKGIHNRSAILERVKVFRTVPFTPMTDKARLHNGNDVSIFDENGFELIDVLKDQIDRRIGVSQVGVSGRAGSIVVGKADDQLEA